MKEDIRSLIAESILCKIEKNRAAADMITNEGAKKMIEAEINRLNFILGSLDDIITII